MRADDLARGSVFNKNSFDKTFWCEYVFYGKDLFFKKMIAGDTYREGRNSGKYRGQYVAEI